MNEEKECLVIAVVNKGNTDLVMEAGRRAGARGGTIAVARGTGNPDVGKYYGVVIQPEKEMVYMVVGESIKDKVMKAIYEEAGLRTQGAGIVFSLPITATLGLDPINEEKKPEEKPVVQNQ
ncbi:MAG: P-II family nitrogen regulator [Bacilli bacterium]|jgi:nitrogen regulatory protein PII|nr:P-II family nitrogen regulator [Bacilli bacterium]